MRHGFLPKTLVIALALAITLAIALLTRPALAAPDRVALVIGNSAYKNAAMLPNPSNDAAAVAQALRKIGFEVIEGRDLPKRAMEEKIIEFSRKLDRASLALFFYAGHGMQIGGHNYLLPTDAALERPGDLSFETIDLSQVLGQMEAEKRVNLVFLDACRDNPFAKSLARSMGTRSATVGQGLASIQSAVGTMIAYATQPDNVALDGAGPNSPFTAALLKHIGTPGLEVRSMMTRVRADVLAATNDKQVPWDHSSLIGEVVLAPLPNAAPAVAAAAPKPAESASPPAAPSDQRSRAGLGSDQGHDQHRGHAGLYQGIRQHRIRPDGARTVAGIAGGGGATETARAGGERSARRRRASGQQQDLPQRRRNVDELGLADLWRERHALPRRRQDHSSEQQGHLELQGRAVRSPMGDVRQARTLYPLAGRQAAREDRGQQRLVLAQVIGCAAY